MELILGLDGGGTKTVAWLAPLDDASNNVILGRGQAGPGNPRAAGFETAQSNIAAAIAAAFNDAKLPPAPVAAACFGLAGAGRPIEQDRIAAWAKQQGLAHTIRVVGDAEPILAAASPDNTGIALICGTGSLAWGRNSAGQTARCGGWGYLLGDEGSAYAIALAGLRAAMRSADGRDQPTLLLENFQQELDAREPSDVIDKIYSADMTRERLAGLARIIFDSAAIDPTSQAILESAARDLAELVGKLATRLSFPASSYPLALTGGVISSQPAYRSLLMGQIKSYGPPPASTLIITDPVRGALAIARSLAASQAS